MMKKFTLVLLLFFIPFVYPAQSFSKDGKTYLKTSSVNSNNGQKESSAWIANSTKVFIEIVIEEYYNGNGMRVNLNLGENYKSSVTTKEDLRLLENLFNEVTTMNNIPDLLGYLSEMGFKIENYSTLSLDDYIRHQVILSQRFEK